MICSQKFWVCKSIFITSHYYQLSPHLQKKSNLAYIWLRLLKNFKDLTFQRIEPQQLINFRLKKENLVSELTKLFCITQARERKECWRESNTWLSFEIFLGYVFTCCRLANYSLDITYYMGEGSLWVLGFFFFFALFFCHWFIHVIKYINMCIWHIYALGTHLLCNVETQTNLHRDAHVKRN